MKVTVERQGDAGAAIRVWLGKLTAPGRTRPLMERWGKSLVESQQVSIETATSPDRRPYDPLSPVTVARRLARNPAHPYGSRPLLDSTALYQGILYRLMADNVVKAGPTARAEDGFPYPIAQNRGFTTWQGKRVPARPYIGIRAEQWTDIHHALVDWVMDANA